MITIYPCKTWLQISFPQTSAGLEGKKIKRSWKLNKKWLAVFGSSFNYTPDYFLVDVVMLISKNEYTFKTFQ